MIDPLTMMLKPCICRQQLQGNIVERARRERREREREEREKERERREIREKERERWFGT